MLRICVCILAGCYALTLFTRLPAERLLVIPVLALLLMVFVHRLRPIAAFTTGFVLLWGASHGIIADQLDAEFVGESLVIDAHIADFPEFSGDSLRFIVTQSSRAELPHRMRLSWYEPSAVPQLGDIWRLKVRLRRPRGFANPGGFDYEGWLFRNRIGATGYVVGSPDAARLEARASDYVDRLRRDFVQRAQRLFPDDQALAVLVAVTVGARHLISREQWDRYAATGTSHLVAISGLHVGLAAGSAFALSQLLIAPLIRRRSARDFGVVLAIAVAGAYAEISGFAVPAMRAVLMALFVTIAVLLRHPPAPVRVLALACILVVLTDPVSVLTPGFRLSFAAVAILIWVASHHLSIDASTSYPRASAALTTARRLVVLQFALLFGLFSLTALIFGRSAWLAPLVNLVALPMFSFVTVPASLAGALLDGPFCAVGDLLLRLSYESIGLLNKLLTLIADWPPALLQIRTLGGPACVVALLPMLRAVLPAGWPGREIALLAIIATVLQRPEPPPSRCLDLLILDVGQGLSVLLRTRRHVALYDTGPAFRSGSDIAGLVIAPYLRSQGIDGLDVLIVSHADQDHAGGVATLEGQIPIIALLSGDWLHASTTQQDRCRAGDNWSWEGIGFEFLHPNSMATWQGNNASCVLTVSVGDYRFLLTGDIEAPVERDLLRREALQRTDIVLVPHHGSRTSSLPAFIRTLQPDVAVVSAGFGNRWGFPKADVVARWEQVGATVVNTATSGAIGRRFCADEPAGPLLEHRRSGRRYWRSQ